MQMYKQPSGQIIIRGHFSIILLVFINLLWSCNCKKNGDYLPPLKPTIPELLKENQEVVIFIEESTKVLNKWSVTLEDLVVECKPYIGKNEVELSESEKLKLGKIMMDFVASLGQFAVNVAELEQNTSTVEYDLNDEELRAMDTIKTVFKSRIEEINLKYRDFGKEE